MARKAVLEACRDIFVNQTGNTGELVLGLPITLAFKGWKDELVGEIDVLIRQLRESH